MKKFILIAKLMLAFLITQAQKTELALEQKLHTVSKWKVRSNGKYLGDAYTFGEIARASIQFYPSTQPLEEKTLVVTGTYTAKNGKVAGNASHRCKNVGTEDPIFKPNGYIGYDEQDDYLFFSDVSTCTAIPVYKVIESGNILGTVINGRTKNSLLWRFLVKKEWSRKSNKDGLWETGSDWLVLDFQVPLTLSQAVNYINGLGRSNESYDDSKYSSSITACLLDTGTFRPFKFNGANVHGAFPENQSNVLVIE